MIITRNRSSSLVVLAAGAMVWLVADGCSPKRPGTYPVSGRVTYKGKAVPSGVVSFIPDNGRMAAGDIASDGRYSLTTFSPGDGALAGKHRVTIDARRIEGIPSAPKSLKDEGQAGGSAVPREPEWFAPEIYSRMETSPLTAEVTQGQNAVDFDLP